MRDFPPNDGLEPDDLAALESELIDSNLSAVAKEIESISRESRRENNPSLGETLLPEPKPSETLVPERPRNTRVNETLIPESGASPAPSVKESAQARDQPSPEPETLKAVSLPTPNNPPSSLLGILGISLGSSVVLLYLLMLCVSPEARDEVVAVLFFESGPSLTRERRAKASTYKQSELSALREQMRLDEGNRRERRKRLHIPLLEGLLRRSFCHAKSWDELAIIETEQGPSLVFTRGARLTHANWLNDSGERVSIARGRLLPPMALEVSLKDLDLDEARLLDSSPRAAGRLTIPLKSARKATVYKVSEAFLLSNGYVEARAKQRKTADPTAHRFVYQYRLRTKTFPRLLPLIKEKCELREFLGSLDLPFSESYQESQELRTDIVCEVLDAMKELEN